MIAWDIETTVADGDQRALAAMALDEAGRERLWGAPGRPLNAAEMAEMADFLLRDPATVVTWNGAAFDCRVMAACSGDPRWAELALAHVDLMQIVVAKKHHWLGLDAAAAGMTRRRKVTAATVGGQAVEMSAAVWAEYWLASGGESAEAAAVAAACLAYLRADVETTLAVARAARRKRAITWRSRRGNLQRVGFAEFGRDLPSVRQLLDVKAPVPRWMDSPKYVSQAVAWIGGG